VNKPRLLELLQSQVALKQMLLTLFLVSRQRLSRILRAVIVQLETKIYAIKFVVKSYREFT
jgi:hypothetical protein